MRKQLIAACIALAALLVTKGTAQADCEAPDIDLPPYNGQIAGFSVLQVTPEIDVSVIENTNTVVVDFGDYQYLIIDETGDRLPAPLTATSESLAETVSTRLVTGQNYLGGRTQQFELIDTLEFDLSGDGETDLLFIDVSDGVNIYPGILVSVAGQWHVLRDPECY